VYLKLWSNFLLYTFCKRLENNLSKSYIKDKVLRSLIWLRY